MTKNWLIACFLCTFAQVSVAFEEQEQESAPNEITTSRPSLIAPKAESSLLLDIEKLSNGGLVTVGERGHILLSNDEGSTWQQVVAPESETLTAVDFLDDQNGVAVGYDQVILMTNDGGETWSKAFKETDSEQLEYYPVLFDVAYVNADKLVAIGAYGLVLTSSDGGASWDFEEPMDLADEYGGFSHFYGIESVSDSEWYLVGEKYIAAETDDGEEITKGLIAKTSDAGETWEKLESPYDGSFFGLTIANQDIYAYGLRGNVFVSKNKGASWSSIFVSSAASLHDVEVLDNGQLFIVGTGGVLLHKKGSKVEISKRIDLKGRTSVVYIDENTIIIVGEGGVERMTLGN